MPKKNLSLSEKEDKIHSMRFIQSQKIKEIKLLQDSLKDNLPESKKYTINHAIKIKKSEYEDFVKKIDSLVEEDNKKIETPSTPVFTPFTCADLLAIPEKKWLVDQVFGPGDIGMLYGAPGCGKTFVVIDMIVQMCRGEYWARRFNVNRPLNVAYCAGEGVPGLPPRFQAALKHHDVSTLHNFTFYRNVPQFYETGNEQSNNILQFILEWKKRQQEKEADALDVLVIDTLHTAACGADENSSKDMGLVLQACRLASEQLGCAIILVHHTNKDGTAERGSSSLRGAMDFMIFIERPKKGTGTNARMFCEKLKDGEQWQDQDFHLSMVEDCSSVCVLWNDPNEKEVSFARTKENDKDRLLKEMRKQQGFRYTAISLAEVIGQSAAYTRKLLSEMVDKQICLQELFDKSKPSSRFNSWVYFV